MGILWSPISQVVGLDEKKLAALKAFVCKLITRVAFASLVAYCLIGAVIVAVGSTRLIGNPWDNIYPEGSNVFVAIRAARTGQLYFSFHESPYLTQSYGPLFYGIAAASAWASRLNMDMTVLVVRLISYVCYLLCGVMVFAICKRTRGSTFMSLLAALMALGQHDFFGWNVTVRPDTIMILATLVSLFFALGADERGWRSYALAGILAGLAFLTKQTGIAVAIGVLGVLVLRKEFRKSAVFAAGAAAPVLFVFLGLIWRKEVFLEQFTSVGKAYWSLAEGARFVWKALPDLTYIVPLFLGFVGFMRAVKLNKQWQLIAAFALVGGILGLAGLPQPGSNVHYFLPGLVGSALLLPLAYEFLWERGRRMLFIAMLVPALTFATWQGIERTRGYYAFFKAPDNLSYAPLRQYRIISDIPFLALKGHDPDLLDAFAIHSLELMGRWDSGPVVEQVRQGKYDLVILRRLRAHVVFSPRVEVYKSVANWRGVSEYGPAVLSALNENYDVFCSSPFSAVLKPKGRHIDLSPEYFSAMFTLPCGTGLANKSPHLILAEDTR
jgi:Dolichyl-phosphate-mannose-protein mannosyltransferase